LSSKQLHIVAFDVPYPADYGGVIDIYYKCKTLSNLGINVILHVYQYGRNKNAKKLKSVCTEVNYYKRRTIKNPFVGNKPYIVSTRNGQLLLDNLQKDNAPILFEGLHCTYHLGNPSLSKRFKVVRTHNIEHHYYKHLEKSELSYFKKYFFRIEAEKLRKYESVLKKADVIAAISPKDKIHFDKKYGDTFYLPAFHSNDQIDFPGTNGKYLLYHGNLSVPENYLAAMELTKHVFSQVTISCKIAGNNPPKELVDLAAKYEHVELITDVKTSDLNTLIKEAHINVLHTNQNTGIKLKLLNALYRGKFAVVNPLMVEGSGLEKLCIVADSFELMVNHIKNFLLLDFTKAYFLERKEYLAGHFSNERGAKKLIDSIRFSDIDKPLRKADKSIVKSLSQLSSFMSYFSL